MTVTTKGVDKQQRLVKYLVELLIDVKNGTVTLQLVNKKTIFVEKT
jgi:hypothetical protein